MTGTQKKAVVVDIIHDKTDRLLNPTCACAQPAMNIIRPARQEDVSHSYMQISVAEHLLNLLQKLCIYPVH